MNKLILVLLPLLAGLVALLVLSDFDYVHVYNAIQNIQPLDWHAIGTALFCGTLIGWERMLRKKELGMRTSIFIVLGTYIFTAMSIHMTAGNAIADPTRIVAQIVSGIGFLGAGVMFTKNNKVSGLTSAATIWFLAALGICIGANYLATAIILSTVGVTILIAINEIDDALIAFSKRLVSNDNTRVYRVKRVESLYADDYSIQSKLKHEWRWKTIETGFISESVAKQRLFDLIGILNLDVADEEV